MLGDVLQADGAVCHAVGEPLDPWRRRLHRVGKLGAELVGQRLQRGVHLVDRRGEHVERVTQRIQRRGRGLLAHTGQCRFDVGHRAGEGFAGRERGSAEVLVQRGGERLEVHLALGDHLRHILRAHTQLVGERLQDGHATAGELEHVVALQLAACHHGGEDRARVAEAHAGDLRCVSHGL